MDLEVAAGFDLVEAAVVEMGVAHEAGDAGQLLEELDERRALEEPDEMSGGGWQHGGVGPLQLPLHWIVVADPDVGAGWREAGGHIVEEGGGEHPVEHDMGEGRRAAVRGRMLIRETEETSWVEAPRVDRAAGHADTIDRTDVDTSHVRVAHRRIVAIRSLTCPNDERHYPVHMPAADPRMGERTPAKRAGEAASASVALPLVLQLVTGTNSIVQVGCGHGEWLAEATRMGITDIGGIDGPWADLTDLAVDPACITVRDLREPFSVGRTYDLALCVEIAEHLPAASAGPFVRSLSELAPVVAFSAAVPGQGGDGHVNEQWPAYWAQRFADVGYVFLDAVRAQLWADPGGPSYLAQNLFLAVDERRLPDYPQLARVPQGPPLALVHPGTLAGRTLTIEEATQKLRIRGAIRVLAAAVRNRLARQLRRPPKRS